MHSADQSHQRIQVSGRQVPAIVLDVDEQGSAARTQFVLMAQHTVHGGPIVNDAYRLQDRLQIITQSRVGSADQIGQTTCRMIFNG
ncbi:hypothetical protein D3C71_1707240 [compost metagenome]